MLDNRGRYVPGLATRSAPDSPDIHRRDQDLPLTGHPSTSLAQNSLPKMLSFPQKSQKLSTNARDFLFGNDN